MVLLRPLARLVAFVVLAALALGGLAVAIASAPADGWETAARWLTLGSAPRWAGEVERGAAVGVLVAVTLGAAAVAAGALLPRRSGVLALRGTPVVARRRAVREAATALAVSRGATSHVRVRLRRRRLIVDATFPPGADSRSGTVAIERVLRELATAFGLRVFVRARHGEKGARVR